MGYLAKSREVLQINDMNKLYELLAEQRAELLKCNTSFGRKKGQSIGLKKVAKNMPSQYRKSKKNIARIMTRINQLKQKEQ